MKPEHMLEVFNEKRNYIGILKFNNGTKIPAKLEALNNADALLKIAKYCEAEGYFPVDIEIIELYGSIKMLDIK